MEIDDELGIRLHDRATRGQPLSEEGLAQLQSWYNKWDCIEMAQLGLTPERMAAEEARLIELRALVNEEEARVGEIAQANLEQVRRNEALRLEIELLRRQLAECPPIQPASPLQTTQPAG